MKFSSEIQKYLLISFGFTWLLWVGSILWATSINYVIPANLPLYELFTKEYNNNNEVIITLLFSLAVYGPLMGLIFSGKFSKVFTTVKNRFSFKYVAFILVYPLIMFSLPIISSFLWGTYNKELFQFSTLILLFSSFVSNLLTSGQEEWGWRGFLFPNLQENKYNFWDAVVRSGIIWSVWHFPFLIYLFWNQGPIAIVVTLAGYTMGIIGATYVFCWLYSKTKNILAAILIHSWMNAVSFTVALVFVGNPLLALAPHLMTWVVVYFLEKNK